MTDPTNHDLSEKTFPVIDTHCHFFNASDLSVTGFVRSVVLSTDEGGLKGKVDPLVRFLTSLLRGAPSADDEHRWLDGRDRRSRLSVDLDLQDSDEAELADVEPQTFVLLIEEEIRRLADSSDPDDQELLATIIEDTEAAAGEAREARPLVLADEESVRSRSRRAARALLRGVGAVGRYVAWTRLLKGRRWRIYSRLAQEFSDPNGIVDLYTPALVDFEWWLDDPPHTSLPSQILLMGRITRLLPGRVHAIAAFDPWREVEARGSQEGSLYWVRQAVMEHGFIGVKIYPPLGYAPLGNDGLDFRALRRVRDPIAFGKKLDGAMRALFRWAVQQQVPIMAHANDSMENKRGYGGRAGPRYWAKALEEFPNLIVNFSHFGGEGSLRDPEGWPRQFISLMKTYPNTYADLGHFGGVVDPTKGPRILDAVSQLVTEEPVVADRLMLGTDWSFLSREANWKRYLRLFIEGIGERLGRDCLEKIMGRNAMRYYGLGGAGKNSERLRRFYKREGLTAPDWV